MSSDWLNNAEGQVLLDWEATYGTAPTGSSIAAISLPFNTCTVKDNAVPQKSNILGAGRNPGQPYYGNKQISGALTGPLDLVAIGWILRALFGAPTTTGSAAPYTHTFKIGTSTPSFVLEKGWNQADKYYLYTGCKAVGVSFSLTENGQLQYNLNIVGADEAYSTTSYQASPTTDLTKPTTILDVQDISAVTEGGGAITTLSSITLNFSNNSVVGYGLGSSGAGTIATEGLSTVDGRIGGMYDGDTIPAKGRAKTESALVVTMSSSTNSLLLAVDELKYSQNSPDISGPAGAMIDMSFEGYYQNAAAASAFRAVLVNTQASYA